MVKEENKRVMITCSPKTLKNLLVLQDKYDLTLSELIKFLAAREVSMIEARK